MAPPVKKLKKNIFSAWSEGYNAGYEGKTPQPPKKNPARKAYTNGYSEGAADVSRWKKYGWTRKFS